MLCKVILTFKSVDEILKEDHSVQTKVTKQHFPVVLYIVLYKMILTFVSVGEVLKGDHSNESY